MFQKIIAGQL